MVANVWNIKQYRTKLPPCMIFVELKPAPNNKDMFTVEYIQQCEIKFEPLNIKEILFNVQTVKDMGTASIIAISNRDALKTQVTT
jgi:hypothetical protein